MINRMKIFVLIASLLSLISKGGLRYENEIYI